MLPQGGLVQTLPSVPNSFVSVFSCPGALPKSIQMYRFFSPKLPQHSTFTWMHHPSNFLSYLSSSLYHCFLPPSLPPPPLSLCQGLKWASPCQVSALLLNYFPSHLLILFVPTYCLLGSLSIHLSLNRCQLLESKRQIWLCSFKTWGARWLDSILPFYTVHNLWNS